MLRITYVGDGGSVSFALVNYGSVMSARIHWGMGQQNSVGMFKSYTLTPYRQTITGIVVLDGQV